MNCNVDGSGRDLLLDTYRNLFGDFLWWIVPKQILRTHCSLRAYCATLWWRWLVFPVLSCKGTSVEWNWQGKTAVLGEKRVPVPLYPPQIPHGLTRDRTWAVKDRRLTAWAMARPPGNWSSISGLRAKKSNQQPLEYAIWKLMTGAQFSV
jgi:hypothetical protein